MAKGKRQGTRACRTKGHDWTDWRKRMSFRQSWGRVCRRCSSSEIRYDVPPKGMERA